MLNSLQLTTDIATQFPVFLNVFVTAVFVSTVRVRVQVNFTSFARDHMNCCEKSASRSKNDLVAFVHWPTTSLHNANNLGKRKKINLAQGKNEGTIK